jgi:hypothetical protein
MKKVTRSSTWSASIYGPEEEEMIQRHHPLRRLLVPFVIILGIGAPVRGEERVIISDLKTPQSPAFVLLGVAPSVIEHPATPRAFAVSFLSASRSGDIIPKDYAVDVAPYWISRHPRLTFQDYYRPNFAQTLIQNLSLSAATSKSSGFRDSTTAIGMGARTLLVQGRASRRLNQLADSLRLIQIEILRAGTEAEENELAERAKSLARQIQAEDGRHVGWIVEVAAAGTGLFAENDARNGRPSRWGVWLTPTYRIEEPSVQLLVVGRWFRERRSIGRGYDDRYDLGGRLYWMSNDLALSAESVHRSGKVAGTSTDHTDRTVAILEYRLTDRVYLTGAFGADFAGGDRNTRPLISVLGINWGLGDSPTLALGDADR